MRKEIPLPHHLQQQEITNPQLTNLTQKQNTLIQQNHTN